MEDIIITILILAFVLISFIRKTLKNTENKQSKDILTPSTNWEDVARKLEYPQPEVSDQNEKPQQPITKMPQQSSSEKMKKAQKPASNLTIDNKDNENQPLTVTFNEEEDLKRAVLYSEILQRKY